MVRREEDEVVDLGSQDSYSEEDEEEDAEEVGLHFSEVEEQNDEHGDDQGQDHDEESDRIGKLAEEFNSSSSKQQQVLKAHISILTSALGGIDYTSENEYYKLGDDALACLRDIKRWLKSVDEQERKWDVAAACADSGLVVNDLIVILAQWENECMANKVKNKHYMEKIALSILEILVPLTWPLQLVKDSTMNQIGHYPNLKKTQLIYKKNILHYQGGKCLRAVIRLTLPIISKSKKERTPRENAILRLCLFFFRNVLQIQPANSTISAKSTSKVTQIQDNLPIDVTREDISLSAAIESYSKNKVLDLLLTVTSLIGSDLDEQMLQTGCLECFYYLIDGVSPQRLFSSSANPPTTKPARSAHSKTETGVHLEDLLSKEKLLKKNVIRNSSSRHGRFGTLLSLQTIDNGRLTVSGQKGISDNSSTLVQLDEGKSWRPAKQTTLNMRLKPDDELSEKFGKSMAEKILGYSSRSLLVQFVANFIEGCFDALSTTLRRAFLSADTLNINTLQYFEVVTWIVSFETERRIHNKENQEFDNGYFGSIMRQDFFALLTISMTKAETEKEWSIVQSCMKCFKEVLAFADLIGGESASHEEQMMSFTLKAELFQKELVLDFLTQLPMHAYKKSPDYAKTAIELTYVVLKALEKFSKVEQGLFVVPKRASNKKQKGDESDEEDEPIKLKSINFAKYQQKFAHRETIQTHIYLLERYQEISDQDIKRCLSYFHRVFYTCERRLDLFRLDFMSLLHQMSGNGPKSLARTSPVKAEVISFTKYYMKKLVQCLEQSPTLFIELCFNTAPSINPRIIHFLEHGQVLKEPEKHYKVASGLAFKKSHELDLHRKLAIIIAYMIDNGEKLLVEIVKDEISTIARNRKAWFEEQVSLDLAQGIESDQTRTDLPPTETLKKAQVDAAFKKALFENSRLRLLLQTVGFDLADTTEETTDLPPDITVTHIELALSFITKYLDEPVKFADGETSADYIRKASYDNDYEESDSDASINYGRKTGAGTYDEDENDIAFETGRMDIGSKGVSDLDNLDALERALSNRSHEHGRSVGKARRKNVMKVSSSQGSTMTKRKKKSRYSALDMHDVSDVEEPDPRRLMQNQEYRSAEFIADSDDENDDDFFEKEKFLRDLLDATGGSLKPEHAKLFVDDSWKTFKITAAGGVRAKLVYDKLPTLDEIVKSTMSQQQTQTMTGTGTQESFPLDVENSILSSQSAESTDGPQRDMDQDSLRGNDLFQPQLDSDEHIMDNSKHRLDSDTEGEANSENGDSDTGAQNQSKRRKNRKVLESDDDDE